MRKTRAAADAHETIREHGKTRVSAALFTAGKKKLHPEVDA